MDNYPEPCMCGADMVLKEQISSRKRDRKNVYSIQSMADVPTKSEPKSVKQKERVSQTVMAEKGIKIDFVQSTGRVRITAPAGIKFEFGVVQD